MVPAPLAGVRHATPRVPGGEDPDIADVVLTTNGPFKLTSDYKTIKAAPEVIDSVEVVN